MTVELMGGSCGVESKVGSGSTFWLTLQLPFAHDTSAKPEISKTDSVGKEKSTTTLRVLLVDDDMINR